MEVQGRQQWRRRGGRPHRLRWLAGGGARGATLLAVRTAVSDARRLAAARGVGVLCRLFTHTTLSLAQRPEARFAAVSPVDQHVEAPWRLPAESSPLLPLPLVPVLQSSPPTAPPVDGPDQPTGACAQPRSGHHRATRRQRSVKRQIVADVAGWGGRKAHPAQCPLMGDQGNRCAGGVIGPQRFADLRASPCANAFSLLLLCSFVIVSCTPQDRCGPVQHEAFTADVHHQETTRISASKHAVPRLCGPRQTTTPRACERTRKTCGMVSAQRPRGCCARDAVAAVSDQRGR